MEKNNFPVDMELKEKTASKKDEEDLTEKIAEVIEKAIVKKTATKKIKEEDK